MNYGNCSCCNKVTRYTKLRLCEDCKNKYIHAVKDYIYEHGVSTAKVISDATGVPVRIIEFFMNNDYLDIRNTISAEEIKKQDDEKLLQRMELIQKLQGSFSKQSEVPEKNPRDPEEVLTGEYHFIGRKGK